MSIFHIHTQSPNSKARTGTVFLKSGMVQTPVFMPIGTIGSVKSVMNLELEKLNFEIILGNTYHLWLNPDLEIMENSGGLHNFGGWKRPILTDSGGFQAFSLSKIREFDETGVTFRVPKNGQKRFLSPEISMKIQTVLDSDIALVLDECLPSEVSKQTAINAMNRTFRWATRSQNEWKNLQAEKENKQENKQNINLPNSQINLPNFGQNQSNYLIKTQILKEKFSLQNLHKVFCQN